jgi:isopenicillin N synthase-like dioxygenase
MLDTPAINTSLSRIPVIDITALREGDAGAQAAVAAEIGKACREIGFLYLTGHGVPEATIEAVRDQARRFFALPLERRMEIVAHRDHYRGYVPMGARNYSGHVDLVHSFKMQIELPPDDPDLLAGKPLHQPNQWPRDLPGFRETLLAYYAEMDRVTDALLRGFALSLGAPADYFHAFFRKPLTQLSLLHYPPQPPDSPDDQYGIRPHSDTTAFTILGTDPVGGLQVRPVGQDWVAAPHIPGAYVMNIGDMMARWTNDEFTSTPHRVINLSGKERISVPFFANPDYDAVVTCLPQCQGPERPAKYPPQHVGEYIHGRFTANWKDAPAVKA